MKNIAVLCKVTLFQYSSSLAAGQGVLAVAKHPRRSRMSAMHFVTEEDCDDFHQDNAWC